MKGELGADDTSAFAPLAVEVRPDETVLHGQVADQAALHGILDLIHDLGRQLIEVRRLPDEAGQVPSGGVPAGGASA